MKIQPTKVYTIYEIVKEGLLLTKNGFPAKTINTVRTILKDAGFEPTINPRRNQLTYMVKGKDLIKLNKRKF